MNTFFTSDTHFEHKNILKFCPNTRHGDNAEDMTWNMVHAINRKVGPDDELFFLGDLSFCGPGPTKRYLQAIKCQNKHLIMGNHDQVLQHDDVRAEFKTVRHYHVHRWEGWRFVLFHYPMREWEGMHKGYFHLYGHVHGNLLSEQDKWGRSMDVGVDARPDALMEPWSIQEIFKKLKNRPVLAHHGKTMV
jgi:calcineurin-like phosphoesterase family protein